MLLSIILSLETARKHYPDTVLFTDNDGAEMLVEGIGLNYKNVSLGLNNLKDLGTEWWALGKIEAYRSMDRPFIHIDNDVFLWKPLPEYLISSPVLAQNPEYFYPGSSWYHPEKFDTIKEAGGWIPKEILWFMSSGLNQKAECCGIFGGCNLEFIRYYADGAFKLVEYPANKKVWLKLGGNNILVEQYYLSSCIEYHQSREESLFNDIEIRYLFQSTEDAFNRDVAAKTGYTHIIGGAKRNNSILGRLERRVRRNYPRLYSRCMEYIGKNHLY